MAGGNLVSHGKEGTAEGIARSPHSWEGEYMEAGVVLRSFPSFSFWTLADGMGFFFFI